MDEADNSNKLQLHRNNEEQPETMEIQDYEAGDEHLARNGESPATDFHRRLDEMIAGDSRNFDSWSALIEEVEGTCPDNLDMISLVYDSFLSRFPLCHWYWTKYTDHIIRLSDAHKAIKVYERAVDSMPFSLGLWVDYCRFGMSFYEDPCDIRRLFKRALMFVRKDYFCPAFWSQYIKFEFTQQHWGSLANIYLQVLRFPTEYLHKYYENFKQFVAGLEEETRKHKNCRVEVEAGVLPNIAAKWSEDEISKVIEDLQNPFAAKRSEDEISKVIEDLQNPSDQALLPKVVHKYKLIGEEFYQRAKELDEKIKSFETNILRRYFDAAPLDDEQLKNWHHYLDFVEEQEDFEWALQLYERCLISCANYPEFWMRYVEFMETKGGRELANSALERAAQVFLKDVPEIHLFNARFKERIGDANAACAAFVQCDMGSDDSLSKHIVELANMQRRLGNLEAASDTLDKAINMAEKKQKLHKFSSLFIHSSRLKYMITGNADAARDVLIDGIRRLPHCIELMEELIKFAMTHEGAKQVNLLDSIVAHTISPSSDGSEGLALKDREYVSSLFLEFVDLCGTVEDLRKAWNRHVQLFPQLVRNNVDKQLDLGNCLSDKFGEQRESSSCAFPNLQAKDQKSNQPIQEPVSVLPTNQASKGELICANQTPQNHNENVECENGQQIPTDSKLAASEVNEVADDLVLEPVDDKSGVAESTENLEQQPTNDVPGLMEINPTSVRSSSEDMSGANGLTCNFNDQSRSIAKHSCSIYMQDQELEQLPNPVSLDNLSLNSQEKASKELIVMASDGHDATSDIFNSNSRMALGCLNVNTVTSPNRTPTDSVQVDECLDEQESASLLSSANHQKSITTKMHPDSLVTPSTSADDDQLYRGSVPERKSSGMPLHSQDMQHQHQQQQPSILHHNQTVTLGSQIPKSLAYPQHQIVAPRDQAQVHHKEGVAQENIATDHVWPINNMPDISSSSTNQSCTSPLGSCPQPIIHGPQGSQQPATTHHGQTLSQTWQYQQHLLQQQYQQQLAKMLPQQQQYLQSYQHQQQPSSWQQQLPSIPFQVQQLEHQQICYLQQAHLQLQPHYHQSTQQVQLQQGQHQQFQQLHEQQLQLYHESEKLAYEMHQQGYQQHAAQAYQTLPQQYQLHQQGYGQTLQQHQQHHYQYNQMLQRQQLHQPPLRQQDDEQLEHHQLGASNQDLPQGNSGHLPGQQNAPGVGSAQLQHLSPQFMAQPNIESRSGPSLSSYNQQPSLGRSPSYHIDTPESAASSHHGQYS